VTEPVTAQKANQSITFGALSGKTVGDPDFGVSAAASSSLTVSFTASPPSVCTISVSTVHIIGGGACTITAKQAGDTNYSAAPDVPQLFNVSSASTSTVLSSSVNPSEFGQSVTFTATLTSGAGTPTGTVQFKDGGVNMGAAQILNSGGVAQLTTSSLAAGTHTITANYSGDANFLTSIGTLSGGQVVRTQPTLSINDVSFAEGNSGTTNLIFTVTLSAASNLTVTVNYATANGTATLVDNDYQAASDTLTFNPGEVIKPITVLANGDQKFEPDETVLVNLTSPVNATISDNQGSGTILNDDTLQLILDESGPDANQAAAVDSLLFLRDPFHVQNIADWFNLGADRNTRVIVFAANLQLNQGETASAVVVNLVDANNQGYDLAAEDVSPVPNFGFTQVRFRLPNTLAAGVCMVTIKAHNQISNTGTIRIVP
jgi:Big-like domain-containing protein/Calx-beta domain-containing protein